MISAILIIDIKCARRIFQPALLSSNILTPMLPIMKSGPDDEHSADSFLQSFSSRLPFS